MGVPAFLLRELQTRYRQCHRRHTLPSFRRGGQNRGKEFSCPSKAPLTLRERLPSIGFDEDFREKRCVGVVNLLSKPELRSDDVFCMQQPESLRFCLFAIFSCLQSTRVSQPRQSHWMKQDHTSGILLHVWAQGPHGEGVGGLCVLVRPWEVGHAQLPALMS